MRHEDWCPAIRETITGDPFGESCCCMAADLLESQMQLAHAHGALRAILSIEPEDHATSSRDFGRGFALAIRLVRGCVSWTSVDGTEDEHAATEPGTTAAPSEERSA